MYTYHTTHGSFAKISESVNSEIFEITAVFFKYELVIKQYELMLHNKREVKYNIIT